jgi:hypothetical protein
MANDDKQDQRQQDNGQGAVGKGGEDEQGRPLTKDGQPDQRVNADK